VWGVLSNFGSGYRYVLAFGPHFEEATAMTSSSAHRRPKAPTSTQNDRKHRAASSTSQDGIMNDLANAKAIWIEIAKDLRSLLGDNAHRSWTARLSLHSADANVVRLSGPTRFVLSRIETDYGHSIAELWAARDNRLVVTGLASDFDAAPLSGATSDAKAPSQAAQPLTLVDSEADIAAAQSPSANEAIIAQAKPEPRERRFTFDNFVVGPTNQLAHAIARKVVATPDAQYNPVVIHGPHGMGKTHLLHAVKTEIEDTDPNRRVHLINSEQFVSTFVRSLRGNGREAVEAFKSSLRDVDLLIIDDAHFIADKPTSQEELLHTLISLVGESRQVLLATDRHPHAITKASDRLKSILCAGLLCDIGPADYELRRRILDRLIERKRSGSNPALAMPQIARDHLAARINATPRDLEGAFNQVVARSEFLGRPLTLESVQEALSHSRYNNGMRPTVDKIQRATGKEFGITMDDMLSKRRARAIARPRQVAMYLAKIMTTRSLPDIGRRFGGRDHTTVIHAVKRNESLRAEDSALNGHIEAVIEALKS